jgi:hypothetical protein
MTPEQEQALKQHLQAIAKILPPVNYPLIRQPVRGTTTAATDR